MENKKKVLFVATITSHIKGFHEPYLKLLKEQGYKTYVVAKNNLKENEVINYCDEFIELPIERNPLKINNIIVIKKLKRIIEREQIDLIHCHTPVGSVVARLAAISARKKYGTRVIYTAHGFHFFKGAPLKNWIMFYPVEWYLSKYTDTLITINHEDFNFANSKFSKRCHDINYVPGVGIDINKFKDKMSQKEKREYKETLGLDENSFVLTCVARLDMNKNQGFLIDVIEKLVTKYNNIHLVLAGRDELNGYYQKIVKEKKLENNIHFLGNREDISELLSISNIVLSASKREGLPVNVMEAFANGKPVVALKCRGMEDLLYNGENGFIVYSHDIDDFVDCIMKLYNYYDLYKKICKNNLARIKNYDIKSIEKMLFDIYIQR